jgi:hypothetical protein
MQKCVNWAAGIEAVEHTDAPHPLALLRARRERPHRSRAAKQRDELAAFHSITSSAIASKPGGNVKPSALAVFKLMTSSNLVGCMIGRSAGFSPAPSLTHSSNSF